MQLQARCFQVRASCAQLQAHTSQLRAVILQVGGLIFSLAKGVSLDRNYFAGLYLKKMLYPINIKVIADAIFESTSPNFT